MKVTKQIDVLRVVIHFISLRVGKFLDKKLFLEKWTFFSEF